MARTGNQIKRASFLLLLFALAALTWSLSRSHGQRVGAVLVTAVGREPPGLQVEPIHELRHRSSRSGDEYRVRNLVAGPIEVRCALVNANNVQLQPALPQRLVLAALAERELTELRTVLPDRPARASIKCDAMVGDPGSSTQAYASYATPFHAGTAFHLDQGFNGGHSHNDLQSRYALDFAVPEGTPVLAARDGVVMQVEEQFLLGGADARRYGDRANYVRVLHDDGSMALYAHLAPYSVVFHPGSRVRAGNQLAKSGNTGFSTGPHLHFSVQRNVGLALQSIPFTMAGVDPSQARRAGHN